jgi:hypothetical protein
MDTTLSPKSTVFNGFTVRIMHSMGLDKHITTCILHCSILQNVFFALKILCAPPTHSSFSPTPSNHWSLAVSIILPFPEGKAEVPEYVGFSDWLLSLSHMHLSSFYLFS